MRHSDPARGQVIKGVHCGVREVALKMLLNVDDADKELGRFTEVRQQHEQLASHALRTKLL